MYSSTKIWSTHKTEEPEKIGKAVVSDLLPPARTAQELPPIYGLIPVGDDRRSEAIRVAEACGISPMLLTRLHRRQIAADTVPVLLLERLGKALNCTAAQVFAYLQQEADVPSGAMYRRYTRVAPPAERLAFEQAVTSSPDLPDEFREKWKTICR